VSPAAGTGDQAAVVIVVDVDAVIVRVTPLAAPEVIVTLRPARKFAGSQFFDESVITVEVLAVKVPVIAAGASRMNSGEPPVL
jgi:hypothetical protein